MDKSKAVGIFGIGMGLVGIVALLIAGIILIAVLVAAYFGFIPGLSDLMGAYSTKDLGVKYTNSDYNSFMSKIPGYKVTNPEYTCLTCSYTTSGSVPVDNTFTDSEVTALLNKRSQNGPIKNIQVKFNPDKTVESSFLVDDPSVPKVPVYFKALVQSFQPKNIDFKLQQLEVGKFQIDEKELSQGQDLLDLLVSDFFSKSSGFSVDSLAIQDGQVKFKGNASQTVTGNPNVAPLKISDFIQQ
ncbi:MAG: hypothetical protein NTY68_03280 [Candidatus Micrarchaeota archaeon]|nr:hypothetical protein [Candidatus Micrarchaeota archaeon]